MEKNKNKGVKAAPTIVGAAVLLGATAFASRLLGLVRDRLLAGEFGAGPSLDAYYAAFRIPDLVYTFLVLGALSAGFIPYFTKRYREKNAGAEAWLFTNSILNVMGLMLVALSILGVLFAGPILFAVAPGFDTATMEIAVELSRVLYISTILLGLSSVFGGVLQGLKRFTLYAIAPLLYNVGIIAGVVVAQRTNAGIEAVAWGVVGGAALHLTIQLIGALTSGWRYKLVMNLKDKDVREMFSLMGPRVVGLAVSQINLIAMTAIASLLAAGSITIFNFANNIQYVPIGIIGISFAIAAFPAFCDAANKNDLKRLIKTLSQTTRNILFLIIPLTVVFLLLRAQIVRVVLGAGEFGWNETILTANVLAFFTLSLFAQALIPLLVRVFFAYKNTLIPAVIALVSAAINISLAWMWSSTFGVVGIAMAFSIASIIQCALLWIVVRHKIRDMDEVRLLKTIVISAGAALLAGIMIQAMKELYAAVFSLTTFWAVLGQGVIAGVVGLSVYVIVAWAFKSEELHILWCSLRRRLFKRVRTVESGDEAIEAMG